MYRYMYDITLYLKKIKHSKNYIYNFYICYNNFYICYQIFIKLLAYLDVI